MENLVRIEGADEWSFAPLELARFRRRTHGLRCGLHSCAASQLIRPLLNRLRPAVRAGKSSFRRWGGARSPAGWWVCSLPRGGSGTMWSAGCGGRLVAADRRDRERSGRSLRFREANRWRGVLAPDDVTKPPFLAQKTREKWGTRRLIDPLKLFSLCLCVSVVNCLRNVPTAAGPAPRRLRWRSRDQARHWHRPQRRILRGVWRRPKPLRAKWCVLRRRGRRFRSGIRAAGRRSGRRWRGCRSKPSQALDEYRAARPGSRVPVWNRPRPDRRIGLDGLVGVGGPRMSQKAETLPELLWRQRQKGGPGPPKWKPLRKT